MAGNLKEPRGRFLTLQTDLQRLGILPPAAPPAAPIALEPVATIPTTLAPPPAAPRAAPALVPLPIQQAPVTHLEETLEKKHEETPEDTPEDNPENTPEFDVLDFEDPLTSTYLSRWKSPDCGDDESSVSSLSTKTTDAITAKSHNEMMIKAKFKCSIGGHLIAPCEYKILLLLSKIFKFYVQSKSVQICNRIIRHLLNFFDLNLCYFITEYII